MAVNGYFVKSDCERLYSYVSECISDIYNSDATDGVMNNKLCHLLDFLDERLGEFNYEICECVFSNIDALIDRESLRMLVSYVSSDDVMIERYSMFIPSILKKDSDGSLSSIMYYVANASDTKLIVEHVLGLKSEEDKKSVIFSIYQNEEIEYTPIPFIKYLVRNHMDKIKTEDFSDLIYRMKDSIKDIEDTDERYDMLETLYTILDNFCDKASLSFN